MHRPRRDTHELNNNNRPKHMKYLLALAAFAGCLATANAQCTGHGNASMADGKHECTAACTTEAHAYAHGEKNHTCTEACKTAMAADGKGAACCAGKKDAKACVPGKGKADAQAEAVKEHACTADCKDGKHTLSLIHI